MWHKRDADSAAVKHICQRLSGIGDAHLTAPPNTGGGIVFSSPSLTNL
jgi:hypothetical protein